MTTKIVKITSCSQCPWCGFDKDSGESNYWGKYYCRKTLEILKIDPEKDIPHDCPLENAGY